VLSKRIAITQSNYIPWRGYFDFINLADEFFLWDTVQYTSRDWRNRNRIKTPQGPQWLTIPVKRRREQLIVEAEVSDRDWARRHWKTLVQNYAKAPCFSEVRDAIESLYLEPGQERLSAINEGFIRAISELLGITTPISQAPSVARDAAPTRRLVEICRRARATDYLTGPAAKAYLDEAEFSDAGIRVQYMDYSGYPEYPQLFPPFEHRVSVLDLLFNTGREARRYMKSFAEAGAPLQAVPPLP
jgi:hypothetical protein